MILRPDAFYATFPNMSASDEPNELSSIDMIEAATNRKVGIDVDEYEAVGKFADQEASPLFSKLPRELRDLIWAYVTAPFEDPTRTFDPTAYYCRPGHTACLKTDTAVLRTCRRIWLEANAMPMLQAEHSFYYNRAAPDSRNPQWMAKLTDLNRQNFGHLHLFVQMYLIERLLDQPGSLRGFFLHTPVKPGDFQPRMLHVTIRHTDFWYWEHDAPLKVKDEWVQALLNSPDLRSTETLMLELETLDYKVDQLAPIVEHIRNFESEEKETHLVDGRPTKTKFVLAGEPKTYNWEGPSNINRQSFPPYVGKDKLKYHAVILTWRLQFPDIPAAFVPQLRRAPRIVIASEDAEVRNLDTGDLPVGRPLGPHIGTARPWTWRRGRDRRGRESGWRRYHNHSSQMAGFVIQDSQRLSESVEATNRRRFHQMMVNDRAIEWQKKWSGEKSLLKFVH